MERPVLGGRCRFYSLPCLAGLLGVFSSFWPVWFCVHLWCDLWARCAYKSFCRIYDTSEVFGLYVSAYGLSGWIDTRMSCGTPDMRMVSLPCGFGCESWCWTSKRQTYRRFQVHAYPLSRSLGVMLSRKGLICPSRGMCIGIVWVYWEWLGLLQLYLP